MKKIFPIVAIVVVGLLAVGAWLIFGQGKSVSGPAELLVGKKEETLTGSLKDLITRGISMKCSFKNESLSGTAYLKGQKYYAEISQEGKQGFIIMKDNCMWTWDKDSAQGVKMCFQPSEVEGEDVWEQADQTGQGSPEGEYTCQAAVVSDLKFNPPTNVEFMDMSQGLPSLPSQGLPAGF